MKCYLDKDINKCPYFLQKEQECISKSKCSFQEKIDPKIDCGYVRKERWYEKYYKNRKKQGTTFICSSLKLFNATQRMVM